MVATLFGGYVERLLETESESLFHHRNEVQTASSSIDGI
jgi:hypothetical protein